LGKPALMRIQRAVAIMMFQDDGIAIASLLALEFDDAIGRGMNGCAGGGGIIDPGVSAPDAMDRMPAHAEGGADAGEFQGCAQESAPQAGTVKVVVAARFLIWCKPHGFVCLVLIDEFKRQDAARAHFAAF